MMALTMTYRSNRFAKMIVVKYLKSIFLAHAKGQLILTDGSKNITFSETPHVGRSMEWEPQNLPAVLIDKATTSMAYIGFSKDKIYDARNGDADQFRYVGGDISISLDILIRARTIIDRENLSDIVAIWLAHPDAKDYFIQQNIVIEKLPTVSGESSMPAPSGLDFPIYIANMNLGLRCQWVEEEPLTDPRLIDVISDVEAEVDL